MIHSYVIHILTAFNCIVSCCVNRNHCLNQWQWIVIILKNHYNNLYFAQTPNFGGMWLALLCKTCPHIIVVWNKRFLLNLVFACCLCPIKEYTAYVAITFEYWLFITRHRALTATKLCNFILLVFITWMKQCVGQYHQGNITVGIARQWGP